MQYISLLKRRYQKILNYIGRLICASGFFLLIPLLVIVFYPAEKGYIVSFIIPALISIGLGTLLIILTYNKEDISLSLKEGGIIVLISWAYTIFVSSLPFIIGLDLSITKALFESMSGWTTTGLTIVNEAAVANIFLFWRSLMQFLGGAGLIVMMLSSIIHPYGFGLYRAEGRSDKLLPHVKRSTKAIMFIYSGYTIAGILLYMLAGMTSFEAINHSLAALSTGGFSTSPGSIGHWNSFSIELVTLLLMLLGCTNFATHYALLKGKFKIFVKNGEIRLLSILIFLFLPLIGYFSLSKIYSALPEIMRRTIFLTITSITTTGFSINNIAGGGIGQSGLFFVILLMLIGGGAGSTAGGIKLYRVYLLLKSILWKIKEYFSPKNSVIENHIWRGEKKIYIKDKYVSEAATYTFLYLLTYSIGVSIHLIYGYSLQDSMFEFGSALGTVGLSVGIIGPNCPDAILITNTVGMFLGRLEFFVVFFAIIKIMKDLKYSIQS